MTFDMCWARHVSFKSKFVQVMSRCRHANHFLSQCCHSSMSPCGDTRQQWVKKNQCRCFTDCSQISPRFSLPEYTPRIVHTTQCSVVFGLFLVALPISCRLNTLRPRQNCRHFGKRHFQMHFLMEMHEFRLQFHWSLFLRVKLITFQHWSI